MSFTLADAERRVRYHLRDRNPQGQAFTSPEVVHELETNVRIIAGAIKLGEERVSALVTTVAGTQFYTLPGTQTYASVRYFKDQQLGLRARVVSEYEFESYQYGLSVLKPVTTRPMIAMIRENASQATEVGFWPVPDMQYVYDAYRSLLPARFFNAGTGVLTSSPDATTIPFDDQAFEALCYTTASDLFNRMPEADRQRLKVADTSAAEWQGRAAALIKASRVRRVVTTMAEARYRRRW